MTVRITIIGPPADVERAAGVELTYLHDHPSKTYKLNALDYMCTDLEISLETRSPVAKVVFEAWTP